MYSITDLYKQVGKFGFYIKIVHPHVSGTGNIYKIQARKNDNVFYADRYYKVDKGWEKETVNLYDGVHSVLFKMRNRKSRLPSWF